MDLFAGIDVSKDFLDLALGEDGDVERIPNSPMGVRSVVERLNTPALQRVAIESTGGYERAVLDALQAAGVRVALVNPWRVRRFGEGLGLLAKTDPIDARLLVRFARQAAPLETPSTSPESRRLRTFTSRRRQLIAMIVAEKARLENAETWLRASINDVVRLLERRVVKVDVLIDQAIARDDELRSNRDLIQSVPCVGPGITRTLLAELPELGTLSRKEVAALVGLAPYARDSGRKQGARRIHSGRAAPRSALYLAALNASRFHPDMKTFYGRLRASGKPPKVALIAVARKLLISINAIVRDQKSWELAST
jgi:transposase